MRIINTVLPLVVLAVHVAGLPIPSDGGSYSKRSDLGSAKAVERRGPHTIASRSGPPDPTPGSFVPSTDKVERRSPTPNPKGGDGDGDGGGGGSHSRSSTVASAEAAAAHDAAAAHIDAITAHNDCVRTRIHYPGGCQEAQQEAAEAQKKADEAQKKADELKAKLRRRIDSWSDLD
ncbi:hypothetical protein EV361DRAFT_945002 [Lentinula raphanica]|nr:hypothetical protein EV361DRAFT_945002 [Lentinula raphanica]